MRRNLNSGGFQALCVSDANLVDGLILNRQRKNATTPRRLEPLRGWPIQVRTQGTRKTTLLTTTSLPKLYAPQRPDAIPGGLMGFQHRSRKPVGAGGSAAIARPSSKAPQKPLKTAFDAHLSPL